MSIAELKSAVEELDLEQQRELRLHLRKLRDDADLELQALLSARLDNQARAQWLTLEEVEHRLDAAVEE